MIKVLANGGSPGFPAYSKPQESSSFSKSHQLQSLKNCTHLNHFKQIHAQIVKTRVNRTDAQLTKLVESLVESAHIQYARQVFDQLTEPSTFAFNTMVKGYAASGLGDEGLVLYAHMRFQGIEPDQFTYPFLLKACSSINQLKAVHSLVLKGQEFGSHLHSSTSLISSYCAFGDIDCARSLFDRMNEKNVVTWTAIIAGHVKQNRFKDGIELFHQMLDSGVEVNELTLVSVLSACANLGSLEIGKQVHQHIDRTKTFLNGKLGAALIDMYSKCGCLEKATLVFQVAPQKGVCVWNAMIGGLAMHGRGIEALERFRQMLMSGTMPDAITFIAILAACSHSGLVTEGKKIFYMMESVYEVKPNIKHYGCLVDILCRAGLLNEAYSVISTMPMEPNAIIWGALLNACAVYGNVQLAETAMGQLIHLEPFNDGNYVLMSNIYALKGKWDYAAKMRGIMKQGEIVRSPGHSLIEVDDVLHEFMVRDCRHPCSEKIYDMLDKLAFLVGHVPETISDAY